MNQQTGAIRIAASFPNPGNVLRPGQFERVTADTEIRQNAILVPQMAVQELQGTKQVYIAGPDNKAYIVNVTLGPQVGNDWTITSGLRADQRVITSNVQKLRDGAPVSVREISEQVAIETSSPTGARWEMSKFFIRRPIVAIVIAILTVIVGMVAMLSLPTSQYPDIVPPEIMVQATYPGADAKTLAQAVATHIEQQMNGVDNMLYMSSVSANNGQGPTKHLYPAPIKNPSVTKNGRRCSMSRNCRI